MENNDVIKGLILSLRDVNAKDDQTKEDIRFLYKNKNSKYIPYWYMLKLKAYIEIFNIETEDGFDITVPNEIGGILLYYAISYDELKRISDSLKNSSVWVNKYGAKDEDFILSSHSYDKKHANFSSPSSFAVLFENKLVFVSEEQYNKAMSLVKKGQKQNEISD